MGLVEKSVLRVAVAELLIETAPPRVVLTEAIEVARRYAGDAATSFVHAVLHGVLKSRGLADSDDGRPTGAAEAVKEEEGPTGVAEAEKEDDGADGGRRSREGGRGGRPGSRKPRRRTRGRPGPRKP